MPLKSRRYQTYSGKELDEMLGCQQTIYWEIIAKTRADSIRYSTSWCIPGYIILYQHGAGFYQLR